MADKKSGAARALKHDKKHAPAKTAHKPEPKHHAAHAKSGKAEAPAAKVKRGEKDTKPKGKKGAVKAEGEEGEDGEPEGEEGEIEAGAAIPDVGDDEDVAVGEDIDDD